MQTRRNGNNWFTAHLGGGGGGAANDENGGAGGYINGGNGGGAGYCLIACNTTISDGFGYAKDTILVRNQLLVQSLTPQKINADCVGIVTDGQQPENTNRRVLFATSNNSAITASCEYIITVNAIV